MNRLSLQQYNRPSDTILDWSKRGRIDLNPPYQRGDVWSETRQQNLIKSILLGLPIPSIILNDRIDWKGRDFDLPTMVVIDGKQRLTAILRFLTSQFPVPGEWFDLDDQQYLFCELPVIQQRLFTNIPVAMCEGRLPTIEAEQEVFELVNYGGVPQGQSDL